MLRRYTADDDSRIRAYVSHALKALEHVLEVYADPSYPPPPFQLPREPQRVTP